MCRAGLPAVPKLRDAKGEGIEIRSASEALAKERFGGGDREQNIMNDQKILLRGKTYLCRELVEKDRTAVLKLFHTAKDYFMLSEGKLPDDAEDFFADLPPGKKSDDKILYGIFENAFPVAVADIVKDFPQKGIWMTGLLLVHGARRKLGFGKALQKILLDHAKKEGARIHRVGVLELNKSALTFWERLGYRLIEITEPRRYGAIECRIVMMHHHI